jgi:hypothetical protein
VLWSLATSFLLLAVVLAAILSLLPTIRGHWMITALMAASRCRKVVHAAFKGGPGFISCGPPRGPFCHDVQAAA